MRVVSIVCFVLSLFTKCVDRERAANEAYSTPLESTSPDTTETERSVNNTDKKAIEPGQRDSTVRISFIDYSKEGILLPIVYNIYNQDNELVDSMSINNLKEVRILQKSRSKLLQAPSDKYCHFSNYVKVRYERDSFILFGRNVLEITERYNNLNLGGDTISILLAENFSMKAADEGGLTGCNDFSYVMVDDDSLSFIRFISNTYDIAQDTAILHHDSGVGESIESIYISNDTLKLKIHQSHQEGYGVYTLNIVRDSISWHSFDSNIFRSYEDE